MDEELANFVAAAQAVIDEYRAIQCPNLPRPLLRVSKGKRYAKIIREDEGGGNCSVHCFVDLGDGDILKAASWKAPAKHSRGNIYDRDHGKSACTATGVHYLR